MDLRDAGTMLLGEELKQTGVISELGRDLMLSIETYYKVPFDRCDVISQIHKNDLCYPEIKKMIFVEKLFLHNASEESLMNILQLQIRYMWGSWSRRIGKCA